MKHSNKAASITFNITIPAEIIREFFDGQAKVESARHGGSGSSILSSLVQLLGPVVVPLLMNSMGSSQSVRVPQPLPRKDEKSSCEKSSNESSEEKPDIIISLVSNPDCSHEVKVEAKPQSSEEKSVCSSEVVKSCEEKPRRPAYSEDGGVSSLNLSDLASSGGLANMMKMFEPMLSGLRLGFGDIHVSNRPQESDKSSGSKPNESLVEEKCSEEPSKSSDCDHVSEKSD